MQHKGQGRLPLATSFGRDSAAYYLDKAICYDQRNQLAKEIYAMAGEYEAAVDQLEYLLSIPSMVSVPLLRADPLYEPLRSHPRFQALLEGQKD